MPAENVALSDDFWNTTTDAEGNVVDQAPGRSLGDYWAGISDFIKTGLGVWGSVNQQNSRDRLAQAQLAAQRQQAATQGQFWATLRPFLPWIIGGVLAVVAFVLLRRRN